MTPQPHLIIAGLGNPGLQYERTRHNIGFMVVKAFGHRAGWHFKEEKQLNALTAKGVIEGTAVHLLLPTTYMNLSGIAVKRYLDFYKLDISRLVVVADDIALSFGQIKLRLMGSAGGHNGLKSVEYHLRTTHYMRLRMGIGHHGENILADYVLSPFTTEELEHLDTLVNRGEDVLQRLLKESPAEVMNSVNTKPPVKG